MAAKGSSKATSKKSGTETKDTAMDTQASVEATTTQSLLAYGVKPYQAAANETYMSDGQRKHFRQLLTNWKEDLLKQGDETIHDLKESNELPADISDQATQEETFALKLRKRDRERKLINKIEEAIQKIDNHDYGYCDECGIEIGIRRLEARPTATLCIDCKSLDEVRERQGR